eukprot:scaffold676_cov273-Pinguiococcus_pyrenoidosus.AAC.8
MLRSPRSWLQSTLRRSVSRRRCLSSRRDLRDKLREQQRLDEVGIGGLSAAALVFSRAPHTGEGCRSARIAFKGEI